MGGGREKRLSSVCYLHLQQHGATDDFDHCFIDKTGLIWFLHKEELCCVQNLVVCLHRSSRWFTPSMGARLLFSWSRWISLCGWWWTWDSIHAPPPAEMWLRRWIASSFLLFWCKRTAHVSPQPGLQMPSMNQHRGNYWNQSILVYCPTNTEAANTGETTSPWCLKYYVIYSFWLGLRVLPFQSRWKHVQPDIEELYISSSGCREFVPALIRATLYRLADTESGETTSAPPHTL